MVLYGVDIHPQYQAGISIEQIQAEGFDFLAVKLTEGIDAYGGLDWIRRGRAVGLLCLGYHYLRPGNEVAQARVFAANLKLAGVSGMVDVEALDNNGKPTLTVDGLRVFLRACAAEGVNVPLMYLPKWYWALLGSPRLSGLPTLWASSYPTSSAGFADSLYQAVNDTRWSGYGGLIPQVLQFTDLARVAGMVVDANAFSGTLEQLIELIGDDVSLTPAQDQTLREVHDELYRRLPTRAGTGADPSYTDTILGYSANADGYGWRIERRLTQLETDIAAIKAAVVKSPTKPASQP